jgi:hypothetical protein
MLNLAATFKVPWLLRVPKFHKPKVSLFSRDFQWLRSADEIRRFLVAARAEDEHVFVLYLLAIYTGIRRCGGSTRRVRRPSTGSPPRSARR